jgi:hypothetical protein
MSQQINLCLPSLRRRRDPWSLANVTLVAGIVLTLIVSTGVWARMSAAKLEAEARRLEPQSKALQEQLTEFSRLASSSKPDPRLQQEFDAAQARLSARQEMLSLLAQGLGPQATGFSEYLRGFARQTPQGLWLVGFSVQGDGSGMQIKGRTLDPALIPEYIKRLNSEKIFQGRSFSSLEMGIPAPPAGTVVDAKPVFSAVHEFTLSPGGVTASTVDAPRVVASATQLLPVDVQKATGDVAKVMGGPAQ